jgi:aminopeptidase N
VADTSKDLFLDYTGKEVSLLIINKNKQGIINFDKSFITLPKDTLHEGLNNVVVQFKSVYDNDGQGCQSFVDVDKKQYIYTQFEAYSANRVLPIFDQPDLKAKMVLNITAPKEWKVLSNERPSHSGEWNAEVFAKNVKSSNPELINKFMADSTGQLVLHPETKVLPCYLFCFVAGEYEELVCPNPYKGMPMSLYCIGSLIEDLKRMAPFLW